MCLIEMVSGVANRAFMDQKGVILINELVATADDLIASKWDTGGQKLLIDRENNGRLPWQRMNMI